MKLNKIIYPLTQSVLEKKDILAGIKILKSRNITMGKKTAEFENFFKKKYTKLNTIMVNSGSSANLLIFQCLINPMVKKLKFNDEILIPAICWSTSLWPIIQSGLKVKFVDIDQDTLNISIDDLIKKISKKTKALMLVHALGNCADMNKIVKICKEKKIILIEDTCEALGSKFNNKPLGTFGDFSSFSFYYSHHITSGEGGMVCVKKKKYFQIIRTLRSHGWSRENKLKKILPNKYKNLDQNWLFINSGFNLRPTDINAAIGYEQFKRMNKILSIRKFNYNLIKKSLLKNKKYNNQFIILNEKKNTSIAWFGIPVKLKTNSSDYKKLVMQRLNEKGIVTRPIISGNFVKQPAIKLYNLNKYKSFPNADQVDKDSFFIGLHNTKIEKKILNSLVENLYNCL